MRGRTAMWARQSLTRWRAAEGVQSVVVVWTHLAVLLKDRRSELGVHLQTRGKLGACPLGLQPLGPGVYVLLRDRLPTSLAFGHSSLSLSLSLSHTHTSCRHDAARARDRDRDRSPACLLIPCLRRDHRSAPVPLGLVLLVLMARSTRSFLLVSSPPSSPLWQPARILPSG